MMHQKQSKELSVYIRFGMVLGTILVGALFFNYLVFGNFNVNISLRTNTALESGLMGYWTFDSPNMGTSTVNDISGNGKTGLNYSFASSTSYSTAGTSTLIVPSGVTTMRVKVWGAGGEGGVGQRSGNCAGGEEPGQSTGGPGGGGGYASADLIVAAGETLTIEIGNGGSSVGMGGGYTSFKRGSTFLIQAGAGGGGGGAVCTATAGIADGGNGGAGGGASGVAGGAGTNGNGGSEGTSSAGGAGGSGLGTGADGAAGDANRGGNGGNGSGAGSCGSGGTGCRGSSTAEGGGGGGGRFGGGGGEARQGSLQAGGGGGGGGSSLVTGTNTTETAGSGKTPGNSTDPNRPGTAGLGGNGEFNGNGGATAGAAGAVVVKSPIVSTSTVVAGRIGQALDFNESDGYVLIGNVGSGVKTIAFWIKADDTTVRKILDFDGADQIELNSSSQIVATSFPGTTVVYVDGSSASAVVATSTWHHVVVTDTTGVNASSFTMSTTTSFFDGALDDVRLYNRVLSTSEIARLYQMGATTEVAKTIKTNPDLRSGLAGHWTFDGPNMGTSTVNDISGNGKTGLNYSFASSISYVSSGTSTLVVPSGVTTMRVKVWGAGGGGGAGDFLAECSFEPTLPCTSFGGAGGGGGYAQADISVTPAESLTVEVGVAGATTAGAGNAGGYSSLKRSSTYLVQAGGGGGGGGAGDVGNQARGGAGGAGGGASGVAGTAGDTSPGNPGGAGTNVAGGAGGTGGTGTDGTLGAANAGGNGGAAGTCGVSNTGCGGSGNASFTGGGGGGGGRFGGGGGENGDTVVSGAGGGGGGGSSLVTGSNTIETAGSGTSPGNSTDGDRSSGGSGGGGGSGGAGSAGVRGTVVVKSQIVATSTAVAGRLGQGLDFEDGTFVSAGNVGSGIKTIAFWIKADDTTVRKILDFDGADQIELNSSSQIVATSFPGATTIYVDGSSASAVIATSTWHHVVVTDTTGVNASSFTMSTTTTSTFFDGALDDVRLYTRVLSSTEISRLYQLGATTEVAKSLQTNPDFKSSLVGHWTFDGPKFINNVTDSSSAGLNGKLVGFTSTTTVPGRLGQALDFDGTDDYVTVGNAGSGVKTVAFWIKADDTTVRKILNIDGTDQVELNSSSQITATSFPGTVTIYVDSSSVSAVIATSTWHHVAITDTIGVTGTTFEIGRVGSSYFDGVLDDVRIYTRVLSASEVTRLYQLGAPRSSGFLPLAHREDWSLFTGLARSVYQAAGDAMRDYRIIASKHKDAYFSKGLAFGQRLNLWEIWHVVRPFLDALFAFIEDVRNLAENFGVLNENPIAAYADQVDSKKATIAIIDLVGR